MSQTKVTDNLRSTTQLDGAKITTGTIPEARISTLTASKLTGALPAISGASLTNLPSDVTKATSDPVITTNPSGGVGSIISQGSAQFGFLQQSSAFNLAARREMQQSTIFNNQAVQLRNEASLFQGIGSIGGSIFNARADLSKIGKQLGILT